MLDKLNREERLRLMRFVCTFAWADLQVKTKERDLVRKMIEELGLTAAEQKQVEQWLEVPPPPEEVDPALIPKEHRKLFLDAARQMIAVDDDIDPEEQESLELLEQLLR